MEMSPRCVIPMQLASVLTTRTLVRAGGEELPDHLG